MTEEIPNQYNPKKTEDKWYKFWEENNFFSAEPSPVKTPYCIVIPPPNVTGILHMGHALNNTIQDILIRYQRMQGRQSLWVPGTDHAGIATQNVVEKALAKEGLKRQDLGRDKFNARVWKWREQYGGTIIQQLKALGASCDWSRLRFTMDQDYSTAVMEVFVRLYEKKLIYQGHYIINWCPRCQTALSDEEAPHCELQGNLYYIKYPFAAVIAAPSVARGKQSQNHDCFVASASRNDARVNYITVATTRPETMLGDTAVAVNPKDKRYKKHIGETLSLPLINRQIKVIADSMVDIKFGTGAVKVTPAHDPNDYVLGKKHNLEFINVLTSDGKMNELAQKFSGIDRFQAREAIIEELKSSGLLEKIVPHAFSAGHCYRCHTIVEPRLSKQWFVKMQPLAKPAIGAVKKERIKFYPKRWAKVYLNWMENIQDWCISRQIWWGHRLPVYYCKSCQQANAKTENRKQRTENSKKGIIVSRIKPGKCPYCSSADIYQDEDVLDTWFSSWLWPFATFGWPKVQKSEVRSQKSDLDYFYPTSTLVTAPEIIFFWVARMIMAGLEFTKQVPFKDIYIHGTVRDIAGKKMSKSLGNIIDPLEIIAEYGADALRFSIISITSQGQDVYLSKERFEQGRNFANKIWNASRFILMNLEPGVINNSRGGLNLPYTVDNLKDDLGLVNRWILSRFYSALKEVSKSLDEYKFNEAANSLYSFFWHEFCDWYLELAKPILVNAKQSTENRNTQVVMYNVLEKFLKALHPFMPFITEEIWQILSLRTQEPANPRTSIMTESWPYLQNKLINSHDEEQMQLVFDIINAVRNMRTELEVGLSTRIEIKLILTNKLTESTLEPLLPCIKNLAKISNLVVTKNHVPQKNEYVCLVKNMHIIMPLQGVVDMEEQLKKNQARIDKLKSEIKTKTNMLANKNFISRAPKEIVDSEKTKLKDLHEQVIKLEVIKNGLR